MRKVKCSHPKCDFEDEFEPDELGINYFQAVGLCPICDEPTIYADTGERTLTNTDISVIDVPKDREFPDNFL